MWVVAALAAIAACLSRRLRLDEPGNVASARVITGILLVAALAVALAQTIVLAVLGPLAGELGTDPVGGGWLLTSFMLASAVATPLAGRLGDQVGHRRVVLAGLALLLAGSMTAVVGTSLGSYPGTLIGRVVQGLSGGVFPCTFGLARQLLPPHRLPGIIAALSAMFGVGGAVGMVAAGPLADLAGLTSVFWLVAALAAVALAGVIVVPASSSRGRPALDVRGGALLAATLVTLLLVISQGRSWGWSSPPTVVLSLAALLLMALFVGAERRTAVPLIDLRLLVGDRLLAVNVATVVIGVGMFAAVTLLPLFAQTSAAALGYGFGYTPSRTGLLIAPIGVVMVLAAPATPRLSRVIGARGVFQLGAVLAFVGLLGLGLWHDAPETVAVWGAVLGLAYGFAFGSLGTLVVDATTPEQTGAATGINTILRTVGGAIGSALGVAIVAATTHGATTPPTESGYTMAFVVSAVVALAAAGVATAVPMTSRRAAGESLIGR